MTIATAPNLETIVSPSMPQDLAISVRGLRKSYGDFEAVRGIDFEVKKGEVFGLLGPNGAGKTTTVEILEGLRPRSAGDVHVLGLDPGVSIAQIKDRIGVCLQADADTVFDLRDGYAGIEAKDVHVAGGPRPKAFQNLDGSGLAGSVRSEEAEHFAFLHLEINSAYGLEITVGFSKAAHGYGEILGHGWTHNGLQVGGCCNCHCSALP